jgi:hypothetical protein
LFEPFHAGLESLRAEAEFFEESDAASAAFCELLSDGDLFFWGGGGEFGEVCGVAAADLFNGGEVGAHAPEDLFFFEAFRHGDFDGAIERKFAAVNADECIVAVVEGVFGGEEGAAEASASDFDLFGEEDFFFAAEEWDFAHLAEVDADGVFAAASFVFVVDANFLAAAFAAGEWERFNGRGGIGDELDAEFFEADDEVIEMQGIFGFVRQIGVDLREGEVALAEGGLNE